ncbi:MAG: VOC family protein [Burkholderiales bacterium]|nr:VOC family protein [Burkholderiales bacterium]OUT76827.1 MAG: lactoylglutathione lyase [Betaproteobacteria bacterium TMED22]|tara:strand:+ start:27193 stop:27675 length:483 start_codon:yes stop_codon:yes gene_type:complete
MSIKKLHHLAMRCRDSEETREFYEDFLGLPLVHATKIVETKTGNATNTLHIFFRMHDGSYLAFFESPKKSFAFKEQHDFDLHTALEVDETFMNEMILKAKTLNIETRGISDHDFFRSVYFRDPNGYVLELTAKQPHHDDSLDPIKNNARQILHDWQTDKI